ncbi:hypothetical protein ACFPRL_31825 [Pseudoclavibacter helvolus]
MWAPEPQARETKQGACGRRCCWRGPHGSCQPVDPAQCRCHAAPPEPTARENLSALMAEATQLQEQRA